MGKGCDLRGTSLRAVVLLFQLTLSGLIQYNNPNNCSCSSNNFFFNKHAFDQHPKLLVPGVYDTRGAPREWWLESCSLRRVPPVASSNDTNIVVPVSKEESWSKRLRARVVSTRAWYRPEHTAASAIEQRWACTYRSHYRDTSSRHSKQHLFQTPISSSKTAKKQGVSILHEHQPCSMECYFSKHRENQASLQIYRRISRHSHHDSLNAVPFGHHNTARVCKILLYSSNNHRQALRSRNSTALQVHQQQNYCETIRDRPRKNHGPWSQQLIQSLHFRCSIYAPKLFHCRGHLPQQCYLEIVVLLSQTNTKQGTRLSRIRCQRAPGNNQTYSSNATCRPKRTHRVELKRQVFVQPCILHKASDHKYTLWMPELWTHVVSLQRNHLFQNRLHPGPSKTSIPDQKQPRGVYSSNASLTRTTRGPQTSQSRVHSSNPLPKISKKDPQTSSSIRHPGHEEGFSAMGAIQKEPNGQRTYPGLESTHQGNGDASRTPANGTTSSKRHERSGSSPSPYSNSSPSGCSKILSSSRPPKAKRCQMAPPATPDPHTRKRPKMARIASQGTTISQSWLGTETSSRKHSSRRPAHIMDHASGTGGKSLATGRVSPPPFDLVRQVQNNEDDTQKSKKRTHQSDSRSDQRSSTVSSIQGHVDAHTFTHEVQAKDLFHPQKRRWHFLPHKRRGSASHSRLPRTHAIRKTNLFHSSFHNMRRTLSSTQRKRKSCKRLFHSPWGQPNHDTCPTGGPPCYWKCCPFFQHCYHQPFSSIARGQLLHASRGQPNHETCPTGGWSHNWKCCPFFQHNYHRPFSSIARGRLFHSSWGQPKHETCPSGGWSHYWKCCPFFQHSYHQPLSSIARFRLFHAPWEQPEHETCPSGWWSHFWKCCHFFQHRYHRTFSSIARGRLFHASWGQPRHETCTSGGWTHYWECCSFFQHCFHRPFSSITRGQLFHASWGQSKHETCPSGGWSHYWKCCPFFQHRYHRPFSSTARGRLFHTSWGQPKHVTCPTGGLPPHWKCCPFFRNRSQQCISFIARPTSPSTQLIHSSEALHRNRTSPPLSRTRCYGCLLQTIDSQGSPKMVSSNSTLETHTTISCTPARTPTEPSKSRNELPRILEGTTNDMDPQTKQEPLTHPKSPSPQSLRPGSKNIPHHLAKGLLHRPTGSGMETNHLWRTTGEINNPRNTHGQLSHPQAQLFQNTILHLLWRCHKSLRPSPPIQSHCISRNTDSGHCIAERTTKPNEGMPLHHPHGRLFHNSHDHQGGRPRRPTWPFLFYHDIRRDATSRRHTHSSSTGICIHHSSMVARTVPKTRPGSNCVPTQTYIHRRQHTVGHLLLHKKYSQRNQSHCQAQKEVGHPGQYWESTGHGQPSHGKDVCQVLPHFNKTPIWRWPHHCHRLCQVPRHLRFHQRRLSSSSRIQDRTGQNRIQPNQSNSALLQPHNLTKTSPIHLGCPEHPSLWNGGTLCEHLFHEEVGITSKQTPPGYPETASLSVPRHKCRNQGNVRSLIHSGMYHTKKTPPVQKNDRQTHGTSSSVHKLMGKTGQLLHQQETNRNTLGKTALQRHRPLLSQRARGPSSAHTRIYTSMDVSMPQEQTQEILLQHIISGSKTKGSTPTTTSSSTPVPIVLLYDKSLQTTHHAFGYRSQIQKHSGTTHQGTTMPCMSKKIPQPENSTVTLLSQVHVPGPRENHTTSSSRGTQHPGCPTGSSANYPPPVLHEKTILIHSSILARWPEKSSIINSSNIR